MSSQSVKPRLYALLVAIDDYAPPVPPLKGCVNDLEKMAAYLQKESGHFEIAIRQLVDEQATKAAIVEQFKVHLGQAADEDVAFFYYSGHGTQEDADQVFWPVEADRKHEALVCFDSYVQKEGKARLNLLADKELRYLIHRISRNGAHVLTIFDCCHSGGNTRNAYMAEQAEQVRERRFINRDRLSQAFPVRDWQDFIFSEEISYEEAQEGSITELLPEGKHIQMAACQDDQSAFEVAGEGVFTKNLLDVLTRCEGAVTYYDLQSRIQNYLKNQFDQTPRVYISGDKESGLFRGFLNRDITGKPLYGNVNFNPDLGWIMDIGAMHGISPRSSKVRVLTPDEQTEYAAAIKAVFPAYSQLTFEKTEQDQPDTGASYKGFLSDYFSSPVGIYLNIHEGPVKEALGKLIFTENSGLNQMNTAYQADYCVQYADDQLFITRPGIPDVPLVQPRKIESDSDLSVIRNYLIHLSQFEFIKNLHNPNAFLFRKDPVEISVFKSSPGQGDKPVSVRNGEVSVEYDQLNENKWGGSIRIVLKNNADRKLYCALLYLSLNFGVTTKVLKEVVAGLDPGREVWALDGAPIGLKLEEEIVAYQYKESVSYLKLIVSTDDFKHQATRFEMPPLPKPTAPVLPGTKGLDVDVYNPGSISDWTTRLITVRIRNPLLS